MGPKLQVDNLTPRRALQSCGNGEAVTKKNKSKLQSRNAEPTHWPIFLFEQSDAQESWPVS